MIINSILHKAKKNVIRVLTGPTHEAFETNLAKTGFEFWALKHPHFKSWNTKYRPFPPNYFQFEDNRLIYDMDFDIVLSQNKFGQYQVLSQIAKELGVPLISLEHTLPMEQWSRQQLIETRRMTGDKNVFISNYSVNKWLFDTSDPTVEVIPHGMDTDVFKPGEITRLNKILSVCNDWMNRDWCKLRGQKILTKIGRASCRERV